MLADDVVRDPKDDELDRSGYAKALAHAILTMDVDSPFVFSSLRGGSLGVTIYCVSSWCRLVFVCGATGA